MGKCSCRRWGNVVVVDHAQYRGQWVAFADGAVIAAAAAPLDVFLAIQHSERHPYVVRVGHEHEPWYRSGGRVSPTTTPILARRCRSFLAGPDYPWESQALDSDELVWPFLQLIVAADDADFEAWATHQFATDRRKRPKGVVEVIL